MTAFLYQLFFRKYFDIDQGNVKEQNLSNAVQESPWIYDKSDKDHQGKDYIKHMENCLWNSWQTTS